MLSTDLIPAAMVASAIAPAVLLLWFVVAADSRPEPPWLVLTAVGLGALCVGVAYVLETWLQRVVPISHIPWLNAGEDALLFAAIPEETVKILIIAAIALRARDFDEPMDGIVYGAAVGLGFAALENVIYLVRVHTDWASMALLRGMLSVPFHGALGAIAGAYIARVRFGSVLRGHGEGRWRRRHLFLLAWLVPVVLHTAYDALLSSMPDRDSATPESADSTTVWNLAFLIAFCTISFARKMALRIADRQKAWLQTKRLPLVHWRVVWAQCLFSAGLSCVALTLVIAGNLTAIVAGWILMAMTVGFSWKCATRLSEAAKQRHAPAVVLAP
jgi:RsiW-degrading membrane proteinase PrsW (M82 family)